MTYYTKEYAEYVRSKRSLPTTVRFLKTTDDLNQPGFAQEEDAKGWRSWLEARFWFLENPFDVLDVYAVKVKQDGYGMLGCEVILYRLKTDRSELELTTRGDVYDRWGLDSDHQTGVCSTPASVLLQGDQ